MSTPTQSLIKAVVFSGERRAELADWSFDDTPPTRDQIVGRTLVSLISPGTEINAVFDTPAHPPRVCGYATIIEIESVGPEVTEFRPGDRVHCMGQHQARNRTVQGHAVRVPDGLDPHVAIFSRLMGVSWTTLSTTDARPNERVLVVGLGIVGNLAAQIFAASGYRVTAVDPVESRRVQANSVGIRDTRASIDPNDPADKQQYALAIDCTGHEGAVLNAIKTVRKGGEMVLVGVPWKKRAPVDAFDIFHAIFHGYVHLRSGWEWELPNSASDFRPHSITDNLTAALAWLNEGRVKVDGLYSVVSPKDALAAYMALLEQKAGPLSMLFDWTA
jgi:2-desacetyl-2-hydroxyethyl bacteriochlorophyllide A dehydrogenase